MNTLSAISITSKFPETYVQKKHIYIIPIQADYYYHIMIDFQFAISVMLGNRIKIRNYMKKPNKS